MLTSFPAGFLNRYLKSLNILARSKRNASTIQIFSSSAGRLMSSNTWSPALLFMNYWLVVNPTIIFLITRFMHNKWFMHLVRLWTYFLSGKKKSILHCFVSFIMWGTSKAITLHSSIFIPYTEHHDQCTGIMQLHKIPKSKLKLIPTHLPSYFRIQNAVTNLQKFVFTTDPFQLHLRFAPVHGIVIKAQRQLTDNSAAVRWARMPLLS